MAKKSRIDRFIEAGDNFVGYLVSSLFILVFPVGWLCGLDMSERSSGLPPDFIGVWVYLSLVLTLFLYANRSGRK